MSEAPAKADDFLAVLSLLDPAQRSILADGMRRAIAARNTEDHKKILEETGAALRAAAGQLGLSLGSDAPLSSATAGQRLEDESEELEGMHTLAWSLGMSLSRIRFMVDDFPRPADAGDRVTLKEIAALLVLAGAAADDLAFRIDQLQVRA